MRRVLLGCALASVAAVSAGAVASGVGGSAGDLRHQAETRCGVERWAVKTLTDPDAGAVKFTARTTSVLALRQLDVPKVTDATLRLPDVERTTYRVRARLVGYKREDDSDIHLVIADPRRKSATMIVEFPNNGCTSKAASAARKAMGQARGAFVAACGEPSGRWKLLDGTAVITGVGFVDKVHGQTGVAPSGIELHPVTRVSRVVCSLG
jgi:hypothetical protein